MARTSQLPLHSYWSKTPNRTDKQWHEALIYPRNLYTGYSSVSARCRCSGDFSLKWSQSSWIIFFWEVLSQHQLPNLNPSRRLQLCLLYGQAEEPGFMLILTGVRLQSSVLMTCSCLRLGLIQVFGVCCCSCSCCRRLTITSYTLHCIIK